MGPADLPSILKLRSDSMKKYVLAKLGGGVVDVEIMEDQWEVIWRVAGDFIAQYFPREQKLAVFWTQPLKPTYPLPKDAYWVQSVNWDPVTTRIDDVFGAESYLFCFPGGTKLLTTKGLLSCEAIHVDENIRLVTPFGPRKPQLRWNQQRQLIQVLKTENDMVACTPNHFVNINNKFRQAMLGYPGLKLLADTDKQPEIIDRMQTQTDGTWSITTPSGCFYVSGLGKESYLVH